MILVVFLLLQNGVKMKKILMFVLLFVPFTVVADTMCVRDRTLVISLDGVYAPVSGGRSGYVWWADFPDGRVFGEAFLEPKNFKKSFREKLGSSRFCALSSKLPLWM